MLPFFTPGKTISKPKALQNLVCYSPIFINSFKKTIEKECKKNKSNDGWISFDNLFKKIDLMGMEHLNRRARREMVRAILRLLLNAKQVEMLQRPSLTYWRSIQIKH